MKRTFPVFVKTRGEKCIEVNYSRSAPTAAVIEAVASETGAHPDACRLVFAGKNLPKDKTLEDNGYNLQNDHSSVFRSCPSDRNIKAVEHLRADLKMLENEEVQEPDPRRCEQIKQIRRTIKKKLAFMANNPLPAAFTASRDIAPQLCESRKFVVPKNHLNAGLNEEAALATAIAASTKKSVKWAPQLCETRKFVVSKKHSNAGLPEEEALAVAIAASTKKSVKWAPQLCETRKFVVPKKHSNAGRGEEAALAAAIAASLDIASSGTTESPIDPWEMYNKWAC